MADIIGVLGENTNVAVGTYTVYTCPTTKAAKVKIMFAASAAGGGATVLSIAVNNTTILTKSITASNFCWSSTEAQQKMSATTADGSAKADTVAPGPAEYYLSAGDIVSYTLATTNPTAINVQVVGAEVDIS